MGGKQLRRVPGLPAAPMAAADRLEAFRAMLCAARRDKVDMAALNNELTALGERGADVLASVLCDPTLDNSASVIAFTLAAQCAAMNQQTKAVVFIGLLARTDTLLHELALPQIVYRALSGDPVSALALTEYVSKGESELQRYTHAVRTLGARALPDGMPKINKVVGRIGPKGDDTHA